MATQTVTEESTLRDRAIELVKDYAIVVYPLSFGVSMLLLGLVLDATGRHVEAGVSGAIGVIVCSISLVVYAVFWILGRFGR